MLLKILMVRSQRTLQSIARSCRSITKNCLICSKTAMVRGHYKLEKTSTQASLSRGKVSTLWRMLPIASPCLSVAKLLELRARRGLISTLRALTLSFNCSSNRIGQTQRVCSCAVNSICAISQVVKRSIKRIAWVSSTCSNLKQSTWVWAAWAKWSRR